MLQVLIGRRDHLDACILVAITRDAFRSYSAVLLKTVRVGGPELLAIGKQDPVVDASVVDER
jgi:hypothetical protein